MVFSRAVRIAASASAVSDHGHDRGRDPVIDGGHTDALCRADVGNCIRLARGGRGKHLVLDDINASWIFDVFCEYVSLGHLATETLFSDWEDVSRNVLARIV